MDNQVITEVVAVPSILAFAGWMLYLMFKRYQLATQVRLQKIDSYNKMIEKFGNANEFIEFIQSEQGKRLIGDPIIPPANPLNKVLRFVQAGVLFVMLGIASWMNGFRLEGRTEPMYVNQMVQANHYGTLAVFLGAGLLIIAAVTFVFVQRWHLANGSNKK